MSAAAAVHPISTPVFYLGITALFGVTFLAGMAGVAAIRPVYVVACGVVGYYAWRAGPARHFEAAILLFAFSPFLRRVVDATTGFQPAALMLIGPMLAILIPTVELRALLRPDHKFDRALLPFLLMLACIAYACMLNLFQGDVMSAASGGLKWGAPVLYGMWMTERAREDRALVDTAARTFMIVTPILGLYGVYQFVEAPLWDRYWMIYSGMTSIGEPEAYKLRVFSMMNSPASLATYAACGLLLFGFCRSGWQMLLVALPSAMGLMLSLYRTAWLSLVVGILFCLLFGPTRSRAGLIIACLCGAITVAAVATPFGDIISDRLDTLVSKPSEDGSGLERMGEFVTLWKNSESNLFGSGFGSVDPGIPGTMPIDGMPVACWLFMGIPVGLLCLISMFWATWQALAQVVRQPDAIRVVLGAVLVGELFQLPLAGIAYGELGVLFWVFAGVATSSGQQAPSDVARPLRDMPIRIARTRSLTREKLS